MKGKIEFSIRKPLNGDSYLNFMTILAKAVTVANQAAAKVGDTKAEIHVTINYDTTGVPPTLTEKFREAIRKLKLAPDIEFKQTEIEP